MHFTFRLADRQDEAFLWEMLYWAAHKALGARLLERLMTIARDRYRALSLSVRADNPAKRLYDRFGFRVVREAVNRIGGRLFVMALALSDERP